MSRRARTNKSIHDTYQLLGVAGQGQYGRVLCARPHQGGELVALKELQTQRFPTHNLLRELRYLLTLNHPNITRCYALEHAREGRYLVLEYCEGGTLRDLINQVEQGLWLPVKQVLGFADQILAGLVHAHQQGVIHCDIKPENILLKPTPQGWQLKLTDFGIARHPEPIAGEITATGSPAYMAPERFYGHFSPASDLYAVGIILVELLTGQRPFSGSPSQLMYAHLNQPFVCPSGIPDPLQTLLEVSLRKLPPRRFRTAAEMRSALAVFAQEWQEPDSCWVGPRLPTLSPPVVQVWAATVEDTQKKEDEDKEDYLPLAGMDPSSVQQLQVLQDPAGVGSPLLLRATEKAVEWLPLESLQEGGSNSSTGSPPLHRHVLSEPLRQLFPLDTFPEALALSKNSVVHLSPGRIRTLLSFEEDWQATWIPARQQLFWATATELGAIQLHPYSPTSAQDTLFPDSHRYFRWPLQALQPGWKGGTPKLLILADHLVLLSSRPGYPLDMYLLPLATEQAGLAPKTGSPPLIYRLPLDPAARVISLGERLLVAEGRDPKQRGNELHLARANGTPGYYGLCSVQVNPLRVRYWFLNEIPRQICKAPWGVLWVGVGRGANAGEALGHLWLYSEAGDPLAKLSLPAGAEVLRAGQKGQIWLRVPKAGDLQGLEVWQLDLNQLQLNDSTSAPRLCIDGDHDRIGSGICLGATLLEPEIFPLRD
ncbi:serine/threonine-protein kinase [Thermostichus vulcanus]|uniref:serine/threonine-protein kinase n=1 Tax=Thermostichus vulcanus TaxID=32053 RepID=UPI001FCC6A3A